MMMKESVKIGIVGALTSALLGALAGGVVASASDETGSRPAAVEVTGKEVPNGPPADIEGRLDNGQTYGSWYVDTPEEQRPDYIQVTVGKDVTAFVRVEEAWPATNSLMFESSDAGRRARADYMARQIQPNEKGETWAPAYARDGKTVVGRYLISTQEDVTE